MGNKPDRILSMLSIAQRGGNVKSGELQTEEAVKNGSAGLVIVADDASENTKKKFRNSCAFYEVPFRSYADKNTLGWAIGRDFRACVAVTEQGLAERIRELIDREQEASIQKVNGGSDENK
ncbi:MAG: ribosomal L7Ae/L30e/S12e/Gadd45 family protein [Lachnospiraceae bacterium]|nr:ribosomal L7Ae/L30e/S12e/Gadd45 family protein [Lachnospiraceae bacterium]